MSEKRFTIIDQLNHLLTNTRASVKGFTKAAELVESKSMENYFLEKADRRSVYTTEIETLIRSMGGMAKNQEPVLGALHRAWMDIKTLLVIDDEDAILEECKRGDENCLEDYQTLLKHTELSAFAKNILKRQQDEILKSVQAFKSLKSA